MTHIHIRPGGRPGGRAWLVMFVPGLAFLAFGGMVAVWPEILQFAVAAVSILIGLVLSAVGLQLRRVGFPPIGGMGGSGSPFGQGFGGFGPPPTQ